MALYKRKGRKICRKPFEPIPPTLSSPRRPRTIIDTPRRVNLLRDAVSTAGILPRIELFKSHKINKRTGYRVLKEGTSRRSERIYNRGRKPLLAPHQRDAIEAVEDSAFRFAASSHYAVAKTIGLAGGSERAIQRNMADHGVGTYAAQQKKFIKKATVEKRLFWASDRRFWDLNAFKAYRYSDESHFACGL